MNVISEINLGDVKVKQGDDNHIHLQWYDHNNCLQWIPIPMEQIHKLTVYLNLIK